MLISKCVIVALLVGFLMVVAIIELPKGTMLQQELFDGAHFLTSGILALSILWLLKNLQRTTPAVATRDYLTAMAAAVLITGIIEVSQIPTMRDASAEDLLTNLAGIAAFLLAAWAFRNSSVRSFYEIASLRDGFALMLALVITLIYFTPLAKMSSAYYQRNQAFPLILDFENNWQQAFVRPNHTSIKHVATPPAWRQNSSPTVGAIIRQGDTKWPGITIIEPYPVWRYQQSLSLRIFVPSDVPQSINVRIDDRHHNDQHDDRFQKSYSLAPGDNRIRIPVSEIREAPRDRDIDLSNIWRIVIFLPKGSKLDRFYLDDVVLSAE